MTSNLQTVVKIMRSAFIKVFSLLVAIVFCSQVAHGQSQMPQRMIHRKVVNRSISDSTNDIGSGTKTAVPAPRLRMFHLQEKANLPNPVKPQENPADSLWENVAPNSVLNNKPNHSIGDSSIGDSQTQSNSLSLGDVQVYPANPIPGPMSYSLNDASANSGTLTEQCGETPRNWDQSVVLSDCGAGGVPVGGGIPQRGGKCIQYRWQASYDLIFLNYHKQGGIAVGIDTPVGDDGADFTLAPAHRVITRYSIDNKLHAKAKWFFFGSQQSTIRNPNSYVDLETYNIDLMVGRKFCLGRGWIELESGARWMEFREDMFDSNDTVQFKRARTGQVGIVFGGSGVHRITRHFSLFLQGYISFTEGDYRRIAGMQNDTINEFDIHSYEVATGFQLDKRLANGANIFFRGGVEFLDYQNLASAFDNGNDETLAGFRDVNFTGFSFRFGIRK